MSKELVNVKNISNRQCITDNKHIIGELVIHH